jgi:twitching motility protein PilI
MAPTEMMPSKMTGERLLALLGTIEKRCLARAEGLPQQRVAEANWEGVLFSVAGRVLATPLGDIKEILNHPAAVTRVPGTLPWVAGVANIRGTLLPIVDLQAFLLGRKTVSSRRSRVLVIDQDGIYSGLLVDPQVGIRRFYHSERSNKSGNLPEAIAKYVETVYEHDYEVWPVFNIRLLVQSPEFQAAAA